MSNKMLNWLRRPSGGSNRELPPMGVSVVPPASLQRVPEESGQVSPRSSNNTATATATASASAASPPSATAAKPFFVGFDNEYDYVPNRSLMPFLHGTDPTECFTPTFLWNNLTSPMLITFVFLMLCMYINCVSQVFVQYRSVRIVAEPLPDLGFDVLPTTNHHWPDYFVSFFLSTTTVRFFFGCTVTGFRIRRHIFRRHIFCLGVLFIFRGFSIVCTMLPNPLLGCETDVKFSPWYEALRIMARQTATCADVMYSGHTVNISMCALTWHHYSHVVPLTLSDPLFGRCGKATNKLGELERLTTVKLVVWIIAALGYLSIVASHFHYTLDVFIGLLLSVCIFKWHHSSIRQMHLRDTWFNKILMWSERGAEDLHIYRENLPDFTIMKLVEEASHVDRDPMAPQDSHEGRIGGSSGSRLGTNEGGRDSRFGSTGSATNSANQL